MRAEAKAPRIPAAPRGSSAEALDRVFFALADRNRREILRRALHAEISVSALAEALEISLPGVLKHLGILEEARLIRLEKSGRVRSCSFTPDGFKPASRFIAEYVAFWNGRFDSIERMLAAEDASNNGADAEADGDR